jgi:hypothetical protein
VAAAVPGAQLEASEQMGSGDVQLVLGPGFTAVTPVEVAPAGAAQTESQAGAAEAAASAAAPPAADAPAPAACS